MSAGHPAEYAREEILYPYGSFVRLHDDGPDSQVRTPAKERIVMINEAGWERVARMMLGVVLLIVGFGVMDGSAGLIVGIVAFVPLLTGLSGWCPIYSLFGFRTNKPHSDAAAH